MIFHLSHLSQYHHRFQHCVSQFPCFSNDKFCHIPTFQYPPQTIALHNRTKTCNQNVFNKIKPRFFLKFLLKDKLTFSFFWHVTKRCMTYECKLKFRSKSECVNLFVLFMFCILEQINPPQHASITVVISIIIMVVFQNSVRYVMSHEANDYRYT